MAQQWQLRRGNTSQNNSFTGAVGEVTVDTTTHALKVHDGVKQGGYTVDTVVAYQLPTSANNYTWYRKYASGWVEQGQYTNTMNKTFTFPVKMANTNYCLIGVGYCIANVGRQGVTDKTVNGFRTWSDAQNCETNGYVCFGMAA